MYVYIYMYIYIWVLTYVNWVSTCYIERRPSWADAMTICQRLRSSVDPAMDHDSLQTRFANMQNYTSEWVIIWFAIWFAFKNEDNTCFFVIQEVCDDAPDSRFYIYIYVPLFRGADITNRWHHHKLLSTAASWMMPMPLARRVLMAPQVGERRGFHKWKSEPRPSRNHKGSQQKHHNWSSICI